MHYQLGADRDDALMQFDPTMLFADDPAGLKLYYLTQAQHHLQVIGDYMGELANQGVQLTPAMVKPVIDAHWPQYEDAIDAANQIQAQPTQEMIDVSDNIDKIYTFVDRWREKVNIGDMTPIDLEPLKTVSFDFPSTEPVRASGSGSTALIAAAVAAFLLLKN